MCMFECCHKYAQLYTDYYDYNTFLPKLASLLIVWATELTLANGS